MYLDFFNIRIWVISNSCTCFVMSCFFLSIQSCRSRLIAPTGVVNFSYCFKHIYFYLIVCCKYKKQFLEFDMLNFVLNRLFSIHHSSCKQKHWESYDCINNNKFYTLHIGYILYNSITDIHVWLTVENEF